MATSSEIQELRDAGLHAAADGMQQALDRYIAGEAGPHHRGEFALVQVRGPGLSCLRPRFKLPPAPV